MWGGCEGQEDWVKQQLAEVVYAVGDQGSYAEVVSEFR